MLFDVNRSHDVNELKILLRKEFDMKDLSVVKKILGTYIHKDMSVSKL